VVVSSNETPTLSSPKSRRLKPRSAAAAITSFARTPLGTTRTVSKNALSPISWPIRRSPRRARR
jgi:hypothetical protein